MTFAEWLDDTTSRVREDGVAGVWDSVYEFYVGAWRRLGQVYNYGTPIYEADWDVLVVVDACRYDLMEEVVEEYEFLGANEPFVSVGSSSPEWMDKTFVEEYAAEMAETVYVCGNVFSEDHLDPRDFRLLDEVWKDEWDDEVGIVHPEPLTDRAIAAHRELDPDRMIVHYMQPHTPYLEDPFGKGVHLDELGDHQNVPFALLRAGELSFERHWELYRNNLHRVLESVRTLSENVDAENAVVTADHGNLFGEWGLYGHPKYAPIKALKTVPWTELRCEDTGEYRPDVSVGETADAAPGEEVEQKLEDLGYV